MVNSPKQNWAMAPLSAIPAAGKGYSISARTKITPGRSFQAPSLHPAASQSRGDRYHGPIGRSVTYVTVFRRRKGALLFCGAKCRDWPASAIRLNAAICLGLRASRRGHRRSGVDDPGRLSTTRACLRGRFANYPSQRDTPSHRKPHPTRLRRHGWQCSDAQDYAATIRIVSAAYRYHRNGCWR